MIPRVRASQNPGSLYLPISCLSYPHSVCLTCLKPGSALLDSFHVNSEGRGMVDHLLMAYKRTARVFDALFLSLVQLQAVITTIACTGYVFSTRFTFWKMLWTSNTTSVVSCMPGRLSILDFTDYYAHQWAHSVSYVREPQNTEGFLYC